MVLYCMLIVPWYSSVCALVCLQAPRFQTHAAHPPTILYCGPIQWYCTVCLYYQGTVMCTALYVLWCACRIPDSKPMLHNPLVRAPAPPTRRAYSTAGTADTAGTVAGTVAGTAGTVAGTVAGTAGTAETQSGAEAGIGIPSGERGPGSGRTGLPGQVPGQKKSFFGLPVEGKGLGLGSKRYSISFGGNSGEGSTGETRV